MNIVCRIDKTDVFKIDDEASTIDFFDPMSFSYTFWNNHNKLPNWYSRQALDLLYISMAVFAADRLCKRDNASDGWSRDFLMFVPVMEYDIWMLSSGYWSNAERNESSPLRILFTMCDTTSSNHAGWNSRSKFI